MDTLSYRTRRGQLELYFDRTAAAAWARLTSDGPVSRIRATVRAGREQMMANILAWLPADLREQTILDAGCGTGLLAAELARRGARVVAVDLSSTLVALARERALGEAMPGSISFRVGDMLDPALGQFDHVVAMDSLIHYREEDMVQMVAGLHHRLRDPSRGRVMFTFAPRTPLLSLMHAVGRLFPRGDRAPAIEPIAERRLRSRLERAPALGAARPSRTLRVQRGFYTSQLMEVAPR